MTKQIVMQVVKNDNNDFINATTVHFDISEDFLAKMVAAAETLTREVSRVILPFKGNVTWKNKGVESDDRILHEEIILFNDGDMALVGTEKYNGITIESEIFTLVEVDEVLKKHCETCSMDTMFDTMDNCVECGTPYVEETMGDKDYQECVICCEIQKFKNNECTVCGNSQSSIVSDLELENALLKKALTSIGFTDEQISDITNGETEPKAVISERTIKSLVSRNYICEIEGEDGADEFDKFMCDDDYEKSIWQPFENWDIDSLRSQMQSDLDAIKDAFSSIKFSTESLTREDFMEFWRSDKMSEVLDVEDRLEIFSTAPVSQSDITKDNLDVILADYGVFNLVVNEVA